MDQLDDNPNCSSNTHTHSVNWGVFHSLLKSAYVGLENQFVSSSASCCRRVRSARGRSALPPVGPKRDKSMLASRWIGAAWRCTQPIVSHLGPYFADNYIFRAGGGGGVRVVELDEVKGSGIGRARRRADWYTTKVWDGGGRLGDSGSW